MKHNLHPGCDVVLDLVRKGLRKYKWESFDVVILELRDNRRTIQHRMHGCKLHHPDIKFVDEPEYASVACWNGEEFEHDTERVYIDGTAYSLNGPCSGEHARDELARHYSQRRRQELLDDADVGHSEI